MSKSQPVSQTTTQQTAIPQWLTDYSKSAGIQGANLPQYTPYTGVNTQAGLTPDQLQALGLASGNVGQAGNIIGQAAQGANALSGFQIPGVNAASLSPETAMLMSPYTQSVIDATNRQIDQNTGQAINTSNNQFAAQHAFGGDRQGVAEGVIQNLGDITKASTTANLYSGGYQSALQTALQALQGNQGALAQQGNINLGALGQMVGAGTGLSNVNTADINALMNTGGAQQQTQSAQNQFGYEQYLKQFGIPDDQAKTFAAILGSLPHNTSTTGTQTGNTYTNGLLGALGLGTSIAGLGTGGGATLGGTALSSLGTAMLPLIGSDRKIKKDIAQIGMLFDGTPVYRFRYKTENGGPMQIGLMAQDVEKTVPDAVKEVDGIKMVDYEKATALAMDMAGEQRRAAINEIQGD